MQNTAIRDHRDRIETWALLLAILLVPLLFGPGFSDPFAFVKRTVMLAAAVILCALALLRRPAGEDPAPVLPAHWLIAIFLLAAAIACGLAANRGIALWGFVDLAAGGVLFLGAKHCARWTENTASLLRAVLIAAAIVGLVALVQAFLPPLAGGWLAAILPPGRGGATLGDPGLVSQFLVVALPLGIGAAALSPARMRLACGFLIGIILSALVFIGRPEGWMAAGGALLFLGLARLIQIAGHGRRFTDIAPDPGGASLRAFLVAGVVVLAATAVSRVVALDSSGRPLGLLQGTTLLVPTTGKPSADRSAAVPATLSLIRRHPLGVGPGGFRHAFLEVAWTTSKESPFTLSHQAIHAGNSFLEETAETGIAGGAAFGLLVLTLILQAGAAALRARAPWDTIGAVTLAALLVLAATAFLGAPFQDPGGSLLFWITAGITQAAFLETETIPALLRVLRPRRRPAAGRFRLAGAAGIAGGLVLLLAASGLAYGTVQRARASRLVLVGQGNVYAGFCEPALLAFAQPVVKRSADYLPRALAGSCYLKLGLHEQAAEEFTQTLRRSPYFVAAYIGRAAAREAQGRWDLAEADYRAALAIWPRNTDILLALANLDSTRGRIDAAIDDYIEVMKIDPNRPDTYFRAGELYLRRSQLDEAIEAFRICGMKNPKYPHVHMRLGDAFFQKGMQEMALRYYQAAASDDGKDAEARLRIANALHALGMPCEAQGSLEDARDLESDTSRRESILDLIRKVEADCKKAGGKAAGPHTVRP